jgi:hypothetical protein
VLFNTASAKALSSDNFIDARKSLAGEPGLVAGQVEGVKIRPILAFHD